MSNIKKEKLNDFIDHIDISALVEYCRLHGELVTYRRGDRIVSEGRICKTIGIINSGYFKYTTLNSCGEERVTGFSFEGEVVTDFVKSFLFNRPSLSTIIAGSNASVMQVPIADVRPYILSMNPNFCRDASTVLLMEAYSRYLAIHTRTPAERYAELRRRFGHVIDTVAHSELASYLTISRRQFQRIRENYTNGTNVP